jgi:hypothetical protein
VEESDDKDVSTAKRWAEQYSGSAGETLGQASMTSRFGMQYKRKMLLVPGPHFQVRTNGNWHNG